IWRLILCDKSHIVRAEIILCSPKGRSPRTHLLRSFMEWGHDKVQISRRESTEESNHRQSLLLRESRERQRRRAAEQRDELAASHGDFSSCRPLSPTKRVSRQSRGNPASPWSSRRKCLSRSSLSKSAAKQDQGVVLSRLTRRLPHADSHAEMTFRGYRLRPSQAWGAPRGGPN